MGPRPGGFRRSRVLQASFFEAANLPKAEVDEVGRRRYDPGHNRVTSAGSEATGTSTIRLFGSDRQHQIDSPLRPTRVKH